MRDFATISARFWTGRTGKKMRGNKDARILGVYLFSAPSSHAIGIYYLSVPTITYETGLTVAEFESAIAWLRAEGVADYDNDLDLVWVREMANHQIAESMTAGDRRRPWVLKELERHRGHRFHADFVARYNAPWSLGIVSNHTEHASSHQQFTGASKPLVSPLQAPSMGQTVSRVDLETDLDRETERETDPAHAREDRVEGQHGESQTTESPPALDGSDPNGFGALALAARPGETISPDTAASPAAATLVPMHPHELEQAIRVAVEKLHPDLGFWRPGRFSTRDVLAFIPAVATKEAQDAAVAVISRRVQLFAESTDPWIVKEGWSVRAFVDRWASLEPIASGKRAPPATRPKETEKDRLSREARDRRLFERDQAARAERGKGKKR